MQSFIQGFVQGFYNQGNKNSIWMRQSFEATERDIHVIIAFIMNCLNVDSYGFIPANLMFTLICIPTTITVLITYGYNCRANVIKLFSAWMANVFNIIVSDIPKDIKI